MQVKNSTAGKAKVITRLRKNAACYLGLLPFFILLCAFVFFPMLQGMWRSLTDWSMDVRSGIHFIGLQNYADIFDGESNTSIRYLKSLKNLLVYVPTTIVIGLFISLALALIVNQFSRKEMRKFSFFRGVYYVPTVLPLFLCTGMWCMFMASDAGIFSSALNALGLFKGVSWTTDPGYSMALVIIIDIWNAVGFNFLIFSAGMQDIPQELYEASYIDGASVFQQMRKITLPLLEPILFFVITNSFISALQVYDIPWIITSKSDINSTGGPGQVILFPVMEMVRNIYAGMNNGLGRACAEGVILTGIIIVITLILFRIRKRHSD